jgi:hypothetical protein
MRVYASSQKITANFILAHDKYIILVILLKPEALKEFSLFNAVEFYMYKRGIERTRQLSNVKSSAVLFLRNFAHLAYF